MLILRNFRHTFRRFAVANTLNIVGLAVAFASFFVIMTQVEYDWNFDHDVPDYQNIIRVNTRNENGEPSLDFSPNGRDNRDCVTSRDWTLTSCGLEESSVELENEDGDKFPDIEFAYGFDDFLSIAQPQMIVKGDSMNQRGILISESMAKILWHGGLHRPQAFRQGQELCGDCRRIPRHAAQQHL